MTPLDALRYLSRARELYDSEDDMAMRAKAAWRGGFCSGAEWMRRALETLRGESIAESTAAFNGLGLVKYGLASIAALPFVALAWIWAEPLWLAACVPAFYAAEAQMVFLFPLVLDGSRTTFRDARRWTIRAGGTIATMSVVLPLAATMLFGGFLRYGFVRSWCLGCLAVCVWYEEMRSAEAAG